MEGGFNGQGEPLNQWHMAELTGKAAVSGPACGFWERPEILLDAAASLDIDCMRLSVEWARIERSDGDFDETALDHYRDILAGMLERGLDPVVTMHHFTHPEFLGLEFWLMPGSPERFCAYAERVVEALSPQVRRWVTINEPVIEAMHGWVSGMFPPFRRGAISDALCVIDNLLVAHLLLSRIIKRHRPDAEVTLTMTSSSAYDFSAIYLDLLEAPRRQTGSDASAWLSSRRETFEALGGPSSLVESAMRWLLAAFGQLTKLAAFPADPTGFSAQLAAWMKRPGTMRAAELAMDGSEASLDVLGVDHYDPQVARLWSKPWREVAGERRVLPFTEHDEWTHKPADLSLSLQQLHGLYPDLPVVFMEHGMATRRERGKPQTRVDGLRRPVFLAQQFSAMLAAMDAGVNVAGYLHWSLVDNYEWGSFAPRFGLFGMDRPRSGEPVQLLTTDAAGDDSAAAYRRIIQGLRADDRSVLALP